MVEQRSVKVRLDGDVNPFVREMAKASAASKAFAAQLDTGTDRTTMLTQSLLAVGPALVPITAAAIPAISGMTTQLAFAAAGVGVAALAFQGLGDALKATNEYAIDPTDANLQKMQETMASLGPAGREFVGFLQEMRPEVQKLQDSAQEGLFPGMQAGIDDLMSRFPQVERIISEVASASGDLLAEAGSNLADPRWDDFFNFLETEARPTLMDFGRSVGNLAEGFANLWMAFDPLSDDFSKGFLQMSRDFATWTDGLSQTQGFQEFLDYIERTGPKVWDTLGALGNALLQIVEAAAPVGEVALPAITAIADVIATIADSDAGPVLIGAAAGISAISRAVSLYNATNGSALSSLLSGSMMGGAPKAMRETTSATMGLKVAQDRLAESALAARQAQFALIPTADKRRALTDYVAQSKEVADAEKRAADASRARTKQFAALGAGAGLLAFQMSDLDEKTGLTNTSTLALMGSLAGPWGAAVGAAAGLALDFAHGNDAINESLEKASTLVSENTASLEEQAKAIADARDAAAKGPSGIAGMFGDAPGQAAATAISFKVLQDQYDENARAAQDLRFEEAGLGDSMSSASDVARGYMDTLLALADAHNKAANEALTARQAERQYQQAIDDAADSVKKNGRNIDDTTEKGRDNLDALDGIASAWNKLDSAGREASGGINKARKTFEDAAVAAGYSKDEAKALARALLNIDPPPPIEIKLPGLKQGIIDAGTLGAKLAALHDKTITITTIKKGAKAGADVGGIYTGGRLPDGFAGGGRVPGTPPVDPTEDNVLAISSRGNPLRVRSREWIINQPQSDKNDRWLAAINGGLNLDDVFGKGALPAFAAGGRYDDFSALTQSTRLDLERQKLRIQDIASSLNETETYGKGKNKKRRKVLRGRAKTVAELELKEAKAELAKMIRENKQLKNYGTDDQEQAIRDAEEDSAQRIADEASSIMSTKKSAAQKFDLFSGGSAATVDRNLARVLANSQEFLGLLGTLKAKGASPWLLEQLVEAGPTGGAIRLARQYATDQAAFDSIQSRASQIDQYTNAYAGLVGSANFLNPGAWNSGISMQPQQPMVASIVGAQIAVGQDGLMSFVQGQIVVSQGAMAQEARFAS
jgi:hypothetical protein